MAKKSSSNSANNFNWPQVQKITKVTWPKLEKVTNNFLTMTLIQQLKFMTKKAII